MAAHQASANMAALRQLKERYLLTTDVRRY